MRFFTPKKLPQEGERGYLSFQGVETAFYVWLNGIFVGYGEDSFTPTEFEVTQLLRPGENRLAVEVYKRSSASWIEDQDFWRFSGIFRDVYLRRVPKAHVPEWKTYPAAGAWSFPSPFPPKNKNQTKLGTGLLIKSPVPNQSMARTIFLIN